MGNLINSARNNTSATVNTNTSNIMPNIKSFEIVVNLILKATGAPQSFFDKVQNEDGGCILVKGRSASRITTTKDRESIFGTFVPLPNAKTCKWNRNNNAVVIAHMEDGTSNILSTAQTKEFWRQGLNLPENADVLDTNFSVICDIPGYDADEANEMLRNNEARSLRIRLADGKPKFTVREEEDKFVLRPYNANVDFGSTTIGADDRILTFNVDSSILNVKDDTADQFDATRFSKSAKRRSARKAQAEAARQSVERVVYFDGAPVEADVPAAPVVETPAAPQVDMAAMIQQAVAAAIAPLTQEIASLRSELKAKDAEIEALKAAQAAPQPVAEATPVVEEVTLEPVSEPEPEVVEEAPAVEETVEEAPKTSKLERFRKGAEAELARKASNGNDDVDADFYMVDFD